MNGHHQGTSTGLKSADTGLGRCDHLIDFAPYGKCTADQAIWFARDARGVSDDAAWQELSGRRR
jgi:hypothetical protein